MFMIKLLNKLGIDRMKVPQHNNGQIYNKTTDYIILNSERWKTFPPRRVPTLTTPIYYSTRSSSLSNQATINK